MRRPFTSRAALALPLLILLLGPPALAKDELVPVLSGGLLASYAPALWNEEAWGTGAELSINVLAFDEAALRDLLRTELSFKGGFVKGGGVCAQWQRLTPGHERICLGGQVFYNFFGFEMGLARETATQRYGRTTSLHVAPFLSAGIVSVGLRAGIPLVHEVGSGKELRGVDLGLVLTAKLFLPLRRP